MKKILFIGVAFAALTAGVSAQAADLPSRKKAPAPAQTYAPAPAAFSWTGFYAGANVGYGTGSFTKQASTSAPANLGSPKGAMMGVQAGYNYQVGQFVAGVEADYDWANVASHSQFKTLADTGSTRLTSVGTLRGRLGFAADRALVYATGGLAYGTIHTKDVVAAPPAVLSDRNGRAGYALGAGIEYAFTNNISAKAEYLYTSLGNKTAFAGTADQARVGLKSSAVKVGLNYHF